METNPATEPVIEFRDVAYTLPNRQQVNFAAALDLLLGEIVRITQ